MSPIDRGTKRRARRIAADEAHSWARNLRLNDPNAKLVLCMLTLYVDGEGYCFVGIPQLSDDTELSTQTVRSRLVKLEQLGAIARLPQWIDVHGRRTSEPGGKRTSDLIRLMIEGDPDEIEAAASGRAAEESPPVSPIHGIGLNSEPETVSPAPALRQPYDSAEGLISEPEPESPLKSPQGDEREKRQIEPSEPEHFGPAWLSWPGHEAMRRDLALAEFRELTPDKQKLARAAIPHFVEAYAKLGRKTIPNFNTWIRSAGFDEFPNARLDGGSAASATSFDSNSREGRAIKRLYAFARTALFINHDKVVYPLPVNAQVLAFADAPPQADWQWIEDRQQIAAWSSFLSTHIHRSRPELVTTRADGARGMIAPWPWPPRKDGSIGEQSSGET